MALHPEVQRGCCIAVLDKPRLAGPDRWHVLRRVADDACVEHTRAFTSLDRLLNDVPVRSLLPSELDWRMLASPCPVVHGVFLRSTKLTHCVLDVVACVTETFPSPDCVGRSSFDRLLSGALVLDQAAEVPDEVHAGPSALQLGVPDLRRQCPLSKAGNTLLQHDAHEVRRDVMYIVL